MVDASRALREFGWKATTPFEEGLREAVEWFEQHRRSSSGS
jgi:nucleoside-diphosphate-sugar epimerase